MGTVAATVMAVVVTMLAVATTVVTMAAGAVAMATNTTNHKKKNFISFYRVLGTQLIN